MANPFCLLPQYADRFLEKVKSGELSAVALAKMSSAERHTVFAEIMGETNATHVNASFESKLLLKNQKAAIERWIASAKDLPPAVKRDLLSRVERMDVAILEPKSADAFLSDLAKQRLGFGVTMEEAANITSLAKEAADAKAALANGGDRMAYGRAKVAFANYVSDLKNGVKQPLTPGTVIANVAGFSKGIKAAFDNSALLRQGWKPMMTHPGIWAKNARQSFVDLVQQFGGKPVMDEVNAEILSRPNALNGRYDKAKLAIGNVEEQFPTTLPEKIPGLGRVYKASEAAFTAFQYRMRADVFDAYMAVAERSGVDLLDKQQLQEIGSLVNSLTARGDIGRRGEAVNFAFFSLRALKANIDALALQPFGLGGVGGTLTTGKVSFAQKQAAVNLVKIISGTAAALVIADNAVKAMSDGKNDGVDWDPRSTDFGKVQVGNTRFDLTGGASSIATLGARLAMNSKKTATGKVSDLGGQQFGADTRLSLVYRFFENKLSPAAAVVRDILKGERFGGEPVTATGLASDLVVPLPIANAAELAKDPETTTATAIAAILADFFGISTNTYSDKKKSTPRKRAKKPLTPSDLPPAKP